MSVVEMFWLCLATEAAIIWGVIEYERNRYAGCAILSLPAAVWLAIIIRIGISQ